MVKNSERAARKWRYIMEKEKKIRNGNEDGGSLRRSPRNSEKNSRRGVSYDRYFSPLLVCDSFLCPLRKLLFLRVRN